MLELTKVACRRGERLLFSDLTVAIAPGQLVAVRGNNGSGKSSLLRMVSGFLPLEQGAITWLGRDITRARESYASDVLYVGHLNGLADDLTAVENLELVAALCGECLGAGAVRQALQAIGLSDAVHDLPVRVLSQGQKRRVALARVWLSSRLLWILDEPFASLDDAAVQLLTNRIQSHLVNGGIVIAATHDEVKVAPESQRSLRLPG